MAVDEEKEILVGRLYGGVAILIRKSLRKYVSFRKYYNNRIIALEYKTSNLSYVFLNVYIPF